MKILAYIIIALVLLVLISFYFMGKNSQNGQAIGLVDGQLAPCSSKPNCVSSEAGTDTKKTVQPFKSTWEALLTAVKAQPNAIITRNENGYLSVEFKSKIFGFVDDFEARIDGNVIQVRSASRTGYSDRGVNRARVEMLRTLAAQ